MKRPASIRQNGSTKGGRMKGEKEGLRRNQREFTLKCQVASSNEKKGRGRSERSSGRLPQDVEKTKPRRL